MKFNLSPSKAFTHRTKERFLAAFDAHYGTAPTAAGHAPRFAFAIRALAAVIGAFAVFLSAASVYADTANVSAENPFYALKRLNESVRLVLSQSSAKPQLEAVFATRRAKEIMDLEDQHPTSPRLPKLANDLGKTFDSSVKKVEEARKSSESESMRELQATIPSGVMMTSSQKQESGGVPQEQERAQEQIQVQERERGDIIMTCETLRALLGASSSVVRGALVNQPEAVRRFEDNCGDDGVIINTTTKTKTGDQQEDGKRRGGSGQ